MPSLALVWWVGGRGRGKIPLLRAILNNLLLRTILNKQVLLISNPHTVSTATEQGAIAGYSGLLGAGYTLPSATYF